jgi:hypothetical protein
MRRDIITEAQVLARLKYAAKSFPSDSAFARELGVSQPFLSNVMMGKKKPGPTILDYLGLKRVVVYVYKEEKI